MSDKVKLFFKLNDRTFPKEINKSITIDRMMADFLEERKLIHELEQYAFSVNTYLLNKVHDKLVKNCPKIKPNATILVKYVGKVKGAFK